MRTSNPDAPSRQPTIDSLRATTTGHPRRPELTRFMAEGIRRLDDYRVSRDAYETRLAQLEHDLETCGLVDIRERLNEPSPEARPSPG